MSETGKPKVDLRFTMVPDELALSRDVSDGMLRVWIAWRKCADNDTEQTHRPQRFIADLLGVSVSTVQRHTARLVELGWLTQARWFRADGTRGPDDMTVHMVRQTSRSDAMSNLRSSPPEPCDQPADQLPPTRRPANPEPQNCESTSISLRLDPASKRTSSSLASAREEPVLSRAAAQLPLDVPRASGPRRRSRAKPQSAERQQATQLVREWWEAQDARPQQNFIGAVQVVERALRTGWSEEDLRLALRNAPVVSGAALQIARSKATNGNRQPPREVEWNAINGKPQVYPFWASS